MIKFLNQYVAQSGFSLEGKISKILSDKFKVGREIPFFDLDEKKGRTIDIIASKHIPDESLFDPKIIRHIGSLNLVIECKNIPGNIWVFSKETDFVELSFPECVSETEELGRNDPVRQFIPTWPIKNIPVVAGYDEFIFDKTTSPKKEPKNLYTAIYSVIKATRDQKDEFKKMFKGLRTWSPKTQNFRIQFTFIQPVIVFTGKMFIEEYEGENHKFTPVNFVQKRKRYSSEAYNENLGEIHIITFDFLKNYLDLVLEHYLTGSKRMVENQSLLKSASDSLRGSI